MKKAILAAAVLLAASPSAWAVEVLLPNGNFEAQNPAGGFTQTITNWTVSFNNVNQSGNTPGNQANGIPTNNMSGLFTSYAKFNSTSNVGTFVLLTNLGTGTVSLTSGAAGNNFAVNDRLLGFRFAYMTNDPANSATRDQFRVHVDFFATATSTTVIGSIDQNIAAFPATNTDSQAGQSPFGGTNNPNATATFNNATGSAFNFFAVDISQFFGSFARVSFIVNNNGPAAGTNGNGLGVSGIVLDGVILTPEPAAMALFALGTIGLGGFAWRRRAAKKQTVRA